MKLSEFFKTNRGSKILFILFGTGSIIWFLIRVIPKPTRASYPCMRASYPLMSAFVVYIIGMFSSMFLFRKNLAKYAMLLAFVVTAFFSFKNATVVVSPPVALYPYSYYTNQANQPIGIAKGIFPGRVVWVHNPDLTNANITHKYDMTTIANSDVWYMDKNCSQALSDSMLISGVRRLGGKANVKEAWNEIFKYYNSTHDRGNAGYTKGEKIVIKLNLTNAGNGDSLGYTRRAAWQVPTANGAAETVTNPRLLNRMDSSPQLALAILNQLVNIVGVDQTDIWIGDYYRNFRDEYLVKIRAVYPKVHFMDSGKYLFKKPSNMREPTVPSTEQLLKFSDKKFTSTLPQPLVNATYLINAACLKTHNEGGITMTAKMHQGSICNTIDQTAVDANNNTITALATAPNKQSASFMHYSLPLDDTIPNHYRHLVDYMGHKQLGGKTLLFIVDATWAGRDWDGIIEKWQMAPFNNDYPSSFILSQDQVAIESVGFDLLLAEYKDKDKSIRFPFMKGCDDYLKQAADPTNWPAGIIYDPEGDGIPMTSLGTYEHWNNMTDRKYSRNLKTGNGIELVYYKALTVDNYISENVTDNIELKNYNFKIYPNVFSSELHIELDANQSAIMSIFNLKGQLLFQKNINGKFNWNAELSNGEMISKGYYILQLKDSRANKTITSCKIIRK